MRVLVIPECLLLRGQLQRFGGSGIDVSLGVVSAGAVAALRGVTGQLYTAEQDIICR